MSPAGTRLRGRQTARRRGFDVYREELDVNSRILGYLNDEAFRNIALGENYFGLLGLDYEAPPVCGRG